MSADYPLCAKYNIPTYTGTIPHDMLRECIKDLPNDWSERFWEAMGCVTCTDEGIYACDVEDTLWSLERSLKHRRWNG
jgi:hypothetical protein